MLDGLSGVKYCRPAARDAPVDRAGVGCHVSPVLRLTVGVDVTGPVASGEALATEATVFLSGDPLPARPTVIFGFPGGGYSRNYFDISLPNGQYSQAAAHVDRGAVFVASDPVGVGRSDVPKEGVTYAAVARACAATVTDIVDRIRSGTLAPDVPAIEPRAVVGIGQSLGGFLLTLTQAHRPVFDGVGFLGWSGIETKPPWPPDTDVELLVKSGISAADNPRRTVFHYRDVPAAIVEVDLQREPGRVGSSAPWGSRFYPGGPHVALERSPLGPGAVAEEAASLTVPVLVAAGEIDVMADPWAEPTAYRSSHDITVLVVPRMGHMHNFAGTRHQLWRRLHGWAESIEPRSARERAD
jgi:pimeloyl-ACP methyl ester carboxylesterase